MLVRSLFSLGEELPLVRDGASQVGKTLPFVLHHALTDIGKEEVVSTKRSLGLIGRAGPLLELLFCFLLFRSLWS